MRSKHLSKAALTSLFVLLLTSYASAASAVLGIDIGQEYIKAALVKPGIPLEIVLTKDTKRKEASAIGFKPSNTPVKAGEFPFPERLYGADAVNLAGRFPHDVYPNLKQLLGKPVTDDVVATYSGRYPAVEILSAPERGAVAFKSKSSPGNGVFTVEELLAMQLKAVAAQAQAMAGPGMGRITDVMFTVPAFFLAEEKHALTLAAELAGLKVMGYVTNGLAVGINYATSRTFDEKTPEYHIVYDMGAGSTTASVLRFQGKSVKDVGRFNKTVQEVTVVGVGYDTTLGGDLFNEKVVHLLATDFIESKKGAAVLSGVEDPYRAIRTNGRSAAKLWREATRVRQIISANTETMASVESLYDDVDFRSRMLTRAAFEEAIKEYESRITKPIFDALEKANITLDQVKSIILHGGAVRTPFVGKKLEETVGSSEKISKNVNPDEAAVFGATFKGAGESGSFKVKDIRTHDVDPYAVSVRYLKSETAEKQTSQQIFPAGSITGKEKIVGFPQKHDFSFELVHNLPSRANDSKKRPSTELLWEVKGTNVTDSVKKLQEGFKCAEAGISTKFALTIGKKDGIPAVTKGWVECEIEVLEKKGIVDGMKKAFGFGKDKDSSTSSSSTTSTTTSSSSSDSSSSSSSTTSTTPEPSPTLVKKIQRIPLAFSAAKIGIPTLSPATKKAIKDEILSFDAHDRSRRALEEARNELEAFTYKSREHLYDESFIAASTDAVREQFSALLDDAGEWLYGDGFHAGLGEVQAKLAALREVEGPIVRRKLEHEKRPGSIKTLRESIERGRAFVGALKGGEAQEEGAAAVELYSDEELAALAKGFDDVEAWLDKVIAKQQAVEAHQDPVLTVEDIKARVEAIEKTLVEALQKKIRAAEEARRREAAKKKAEEEEAAKKKKAEEEEAAKKSKEAAAAAADKAKTETVKDEL